VPAFLADQPIIDAHVHFTLRSRLRQSWIDSHALGRDGRDWTKDEYQRDTQGFRVVGVVFVEVDVDRVSAEDEAKWISAVCEADCKAQAEDEAHVSVPVLAAVVHAPLSEGSLTGAFLDRVASPHVKGVRRLVQAESDPNFCLNPRFLEGMSEVKARGLVVDLGVRHVNLASNLQLLRKFPDVRFVLDHLGKPDIANWVRGTSGAQTTDQFSFDSWAADIKELASCPNVFCKISGAVTEADHSQWKPSDLEPFLLHCIRTFGYERCLFGSDWFVCTQAASWREWVCTLSDIVERAGATTTERHSLFCATAVRAYGLDEHPSVRTVLQPKHV